MWLFDQPVDDEPSVGDEMLTYAFALVCGGAADDDVLRVGRGTGSLAVRCEGTEELVDVQHG